MVCWSVLYCALLLMLQCRERMLTILDDSDMTNNAGISSTERLDSAELPIDGSSTRFRAFSDFR
jgi:hypothetical protein